MCLEPLCACFPFQFNNSCKKVVLFCFVLFLFSFFLFFCLFVCFFQGTYPFSSKHISSVVLICAIRWHSRFTLHFLSLSCCLQRAPAANKRIRFWFYSISGRKCNQKIFCEKWITICRPNLKPSPPQTVTSKVTVTVFL